MRSSRSRLWVVATTLASLVAFSFAASPPASAAATTVVTLTYDDGVADVYQAGQLMADRGMAGTFFINSGAVGSANYLTRAQVESLHTQGHEIGGHTAGHVNLTAVSADEARRQICNDRSALLGWGYPVTSFAYPYSAVNAAVETYVQGCGYNSGRQIGDIRSPQGCSGCDYAEGIPPADPYYTRAPDSVQSTWSPADIEGLVTQAQNNGGGWVQVTFHHICDGCDIYGVSPATYTAFLDWLQGQVSSGAVQVRTVDQVMGGSVHAAVAGPPPPPPAGYGVNALVNPGLESSADGVNPTCWTVAGYGTNTFTAARTADAHGGSWAGSLSVTAWTSGDRKLLSRMDLGECSPSVSSGHRYQASVWYKSTAAVAFVAYYRNANGGWAYWATGPGQPAGSSWRQASWTMPVLPAGATAVSFGLALTSLGSVTVDDLALVDVPPDTTAPSVSLTAPTAGSGVTGTVALSAAASDDVGVTRVDFAVDGRVIGSAATAPYTAWWSSDTAADGPHAVTATAYDAAGNASAPSAVTVTSSNAARNLLVNPSLENVGGTVPNCWQAASSGTNAGSVALSADARSGSRAESVTLTSWTSGDRKLVVKQDAGACAPAATAGHMYQVSVWYKSSVAVPLVVYYRNASGSWVYWRTSPVQPGSGTWRQATWTTPTVPAGATALSYGLALTSVGTLTTDDYALVDLG
ncbi:MAG TPA: polysaccharide deacetylase family protein [Kineosporiaceae bacterium]|nr:polysaccharide deacetylase family protein [Kineosporiaceae bacterium]